MGVGAGNGPLCLLEQDFATCDHFLKFEISQELSKAGGWGWWKAGIRVWDEKLLKHNKE